MSVKRFLAVTLAITLRVIGVVLMLGMLGMMCFLSYAAAKETKLSDFGIAALVVVAILVLIAAIGWAFEYPIRRRVSGTTRATQGSQK